MVMELVQKEHRTLEIEESGVEMIPYLIKLGFQSHLVSYFLTFHLSFHLIISHLTSSLSLLLKEATPLSPLPLKVFMNKRTNFEFPSWVSGN